MCSLIEFGLDMDAIKTVVQTKTLLVVLDSIATQVKKLMDIREQITKDVCKFEMAKEQRWKNQCECVESLQISISKLLIASSNLDQIDLKESKQVLENVGDEIRSTFSVLSDKRSDERPWMELEKSLKNLLQAIIKIALANDDIAIAKITKMLSKAKKHFIYFLSEYEFSRMDGKFLTFLNWMLQASQLLSARQQEIICPEIKKTILINVFLVKKVSSVLKEMLDAQNSENVYISLQQYEALKISLGDKVLKSISILIETIQRGASSIQKDNVYTKSNTFAFSINKILTRLRSECDWESRFDLHVHSVIKHSLYIADLSQNQSKDIITGFSNEVTKLHEQLVATKETLSKCETANLRLQFKLECNSFLDELENLEYHVNIAMLDIILESFLLSETPNEIHSAIGKNAANEQDLHKACELIAESSTNINGVCSTGAAVTILRFLRKQLNCTQNKQILEFLSSNYFKQLSSISNFLDEIADPTAIVNISFLKLEQDISQLKQVLYVQSNEDMSPIVNKIIGRAQRVYRASRKNVPPQANSDDFGNLISNLDTAIFAFVTTVHQKQDNVADLQAHRRLYKHAKIIVNCVEKLNAMFQTLNQDTWNTNTCSISSPSPTLNQSKVYRTVFHSHHIADTAMDDSINQSNCQTLCNNLTDVLEALTGIANTFDFSRTPAVANPSPSFPTTSHDVDASESSCLSTLITTAERLADIDRITQKMHKLKIQPISGLSKDNYQFF